MSRSERNSDNFIHTSKKETLESKTHDVSASMHEKSTEALIQWLTLVNRTAPMPMPQVRPFDPFMPQYARGENALRPEQPTSQVTTQVSVTSSSNNFTPTVIETNASSPVPIVDSKILNTIPLSGEIADAPKTEDSDKEYPFEDTPVILSSENDIEDKENITDENNILNKIILKYTYKDDQWSPLNPEGKKQYDRDFLLQLQSQPMCLCKPSNLPNLNVVKNKAHIQRLPEVNRTVPMPMPQVRPIDPFMPQYARGGNALRPSSNKRRQKRTSCPICKQKFSVDVIPEHVKSCPERYFQCQLCWEHVLQKDKDSHLSSKCKMLQKETLYDLYECPLCNELLPENEKTIHETFRCKVLLETNVGALCEKSIPSSPVLLHKNKILLDLKKLFDKQEDCDVIIRVKGQEFSAHKIILKARSPVFTAIFQSDMKEKSTGMVDIEDCNPSSFSEFLCFLYSENVDNLSQENVFSLFTTADKYDVPDLREICLEFMKKNLCIDTFCDTITVALKHSETELIDLATDFFIKNAEKIIVTVKWQSFLKENPTQSNELFLKFVASNKRSNN